MLTDDLIRYIQTYREIANIIPLILALLALDHPASISDLATITGIHRQTISGWLRDLQHIQPPPITRVKGKQWILTPQGRDTLRSSIMPPEVIHILSTSCAKLSTGKPDSMSNDSTLAHSRMSNHSTFPLENENPSYSLLTTTHILNKLKGSSSSQNANDSTSAIWEMLADVGISRNAYTERVISMPHITPEFVENTIEFMRGRGKISETGIILMRLENHEPVPVTRAATNNHMDRSKYAEWGA